MANPPVVLDTCTFDNKGFMRWVRSYRGDKEIPAVVYCELAVIFVQRRGDTSRLDGLLSGAGITVSDMQREHGRRAATFAADDPEWRKNWRDYMIAAHAATPPYYLVTENVADFACIGRRVSRPQGFMDGIADQSIK